MTFEDVNRSIQELFNVASELDAQQILDIIVKSVDVSGEQDEQPAYDNKFSLYEECLEQLDVDTILDAFYSSFEHANLATVLFTELNIGGKMEDRIDDMRHTSSVKEAPDNYYLQTLNYTIDRPKVGIKLSKTDALKVVASAYVAIDRGDNYTTVGYPPVRFIEEVAGLNCSRQDYCATILDLCKNPKPFRELLKLVVTSENINLKPVYEAYDNLYKNTGSREEPEPVISIVKKAIKEKKRIRDLVTFPSEETSQRILSGAADRFDSGMSRIKNRTNKFLPAVWWLVLLVNLLTVIWVAVIIVMVFTQPLNVMSTGWGAKIAGIPLLGGIVKGVVTGSVKVGYALRYAVQEVVSAFILVTTIRSRRGMFNMRNFGKISVMIYTLLTVFGLVFNVIFLIRSGMSVYSAYGSELFWASFLEAMS